MQMYKGVSIATAKVQISILCHIQATLEEREGIPHHLLDFVDPQEEITIHEFNQQAMSIISFSLNDLSFLNIT